MDKFKAAGDELDQISDAISIMERRMKAVQAAAEKRMVALRHKRCESLIATKERRIELAAYVLNQKMVDYAAATTMRTNIWTPNNDEVKTFIDTIFDSIDNNGERKDIIDALLRLQTKYSVEKQQSERIYIP